MLVFPVKLSEGLRAGNVKTQIFDDSRGNIWTLCIYSIYTGVHSGHVHTLHSGPVEWIQVN